MNVAYALSKGTCIAGPTLVLSHFFSSYLSSYVLHKLLGQEAVEKLLSEPQIVLILASFL